jgi:hypothetical protein
MAILCEQFKSMAQSDTAPDAFCQLPGLDVVHFASLAVLENDTLAAQPQPTIILSQKWAQMQEKQYITCTECTSTSHPFWLLRG